MLVYFSPEFLLKGGVYSGKEMKIGVISDTHLHKLTREFRAIYEEYLSDKDIILHAGDVVSSEVVDFLKGKNFHGVHGNMDPPELKSALPDKKIIDLGGVRLGLIHGWGSPVGLEHRIWTEFKRVDAIVYGHSHHAANHVREGVLLFNPGTATGFTSSGIRTLGVLEVGDSIRGQIIRL